MSAYPIAGAAVADKAGTDPGAPRAEVDEQLRWFCIVPTDEEEERIARGETVTFLVDA